MRRSILCLALALVLGTASLSGLHAEEETPTRLPLPADLGAADAWYGLYVAGSKSGWAHETVERLGSGRVAMWVVRLDAHLEMKVMGQVGKLAFGEMLVFDGNPPYALRRAVSYNQDGENRRMIRLASSPAGLLARISEGGETRERRSEAVDYTFEDYWTPFTWVAEGRTLGDRIRVQQVSVDDVQGDLVEYTVEEETTEIRSGVRVVVYELSMTSDREGDAGDVSIDAAGHVLAMKMGGLFEMRLESEAIAKQIEVGGDVFFKGNVEIDASLGNPTKVRRLVVEVNGEEAGRLANAPRQRVADEGDTVVLHLGDVHPDGFSALPEEIVESLREETEYPIHHPGVVELAKRAIGDATTDREKVARLVSFVDEYVKDEALPNSLSVIEMLKTPKGDCSEHALLFTALARAVGIPAHEVSGLMYMGDKHRAFGAHAWAEVVLDGMWVAVDPAWNQLELDGTHVTLSRTDRDQMRMLHLFGKIEFTLREVERAD